MLANDSSVLFGERINQDGSVCWQLPGGKLKLNETPLEAANRELFEETGLRAQSLTLIAVTDNRLANNVQTISLCFEGVCVDSRHQQNSEPERCRGWHWKPWHNLAGELFLPLKILRNTGYQPFSSRDSQIHVSF